MRDRLPLAVAVGLLGLLAGSLIRLKQLLPTLIQRNVLTVSIFPTIGLVEFLVSPLALFAVGYWAGTRTDLEREYRKLGLLFGLVGGATTFLASLVVSLVGVADVVFHNPLEVVGFAVSTGFVQVFNFAITGIAGAAVATFRRG